MRKSKLTGILLKQSEYSDSSLVLKFFCINHGLISVLAKGIRRKTEREQLNNLCEYELELYEPREVGLWLLVEHCQLQDFSRLANPATWAAAECGLELASQMMVSPDEHSLIYLLTTSYLTYLQNVRNNAVLIFWRFFLRLIRQSGIGSPFDTCCLCLAPQSEYLAYDQSQAGLVCRNCLGDLNFNDHLQMLSPNSSRILALMPEIGKHLETLLIRKAEVTEINILLENYWSSHHKQTLKLKSLSVLCQFY